MLNDDAFVELHVGELGKDTTSWVPMAGLLHHGERTEDDSVDILKQLRDKYCEELWKRRLRNREVWLRGQSDGSALKN